MMGPRAPMLAGTLRSLAPKRPTRNNRQTAPVVCALPGWNRARQPTPTAFRNYQELLYVVANLYELVNAIYVGDASISREHGTRFCCCCFNKGKG